MCIMVAEQNGVRTSSSGGSAVSVRAFRSTMYDLLVVSMYVVLVSIEYYYYSTYRKASSTTMVKL